MKKTPFPEVFFLDYNKKSLQEVLLYHEFFDDFLFIFFMKCYTKNKKRASPVKEYPILYG